MPTGKRSRKGKASVSTVNKEESDSKNRQEETSVLKQSIPWLEDFEMQFKSRLATFDQLLADKLSRLERHFAVTCLKIPPEIGNSKLYALKVNGEFNANDTTVTDCSIQEAVTTVKSRHRARTRCATVTSSTTSTEPRRVTRSISLNSEDRMPPPTTTDTRRKLMTPACKRTIPSNHSLITPKVAPNAPLSMVRHPREGEFAVSLSGSPLIVSSTFREQNANVNLRLADGRVVSILPEPNLRPYDIPQVDEETRQQLLTLRKHVDALINMSNF